MSGLLSVAAVNPETASYPSNYLNPGTSQNAATLLLALSITVLVDLPYFHLSVVDMWFVTSNIPGVYFVSFWV